MAKKNAATASEIRVLEEQIATLPIGYVSRKTIQGKTRYYHQWKENGKLRSKYLKDGELEPLRAQIEKRRELQARLRKLQSTAGIAAVSVADFETNVVTGNALFAMAKSVRSWEKRDCYAQLADYLDSSVTDRVCLIFGLRRTGKTTMARQAIGDMTPAQVEKAAYIKAATADTMAAVNRDLKKLATRGYRYVFIDEVTLIPDFIDSAALFSDVYAAQGMKIVLSGTDSLGFWFTLHQELYDRAVTMHTTFIPFREHSRLLHIDDIDEYIRYGGTLRAGKTAFGDEAVNADDASFRDDESTRRYIDTAICRNIQRSLAYCEDGGHFRHLRSLYEAGELTSAINRIIEDMNHSFLLSVLTRDFVSHDLWLSARNLRQDRREDRRTDILDRIDTEAVTKRLREILDIRNKEELSIGIMPAHVAEIKEYLRALDLIVDCPIETTVPDAEPIEHILFTQPGMRYCQAQALVYSLMQDQEFSALSEFEKKTVSDRILEEVRGRMLEEIVLLETTKALGDGCRVFKLQFDVGEFDMVVYDENAGTCRAYEIKHSREAVPEQRRHLLDAGKCAAAEKRFGAITGRYILYRGEDMDSGDGILYRNAENYLRGLPDSARLSEDQGLDMRL